ncbi:MAG: hypothetical protein FJX52_04235 [Alphaproteobacteria bacterium]|nr:hypothetical protein [Alphaproteobacteria bacterium]
MKALRHWSVRHARGLERLYAVVERALMAFGPALAWVGFARLEKPTAAVERLVKSALFDCRMCGQCALSSTGMSCPMNCPKGLRNGPCGGVRQDGTCEVVPAMACVWVEAWRGSRAMAGGDLIQQVQAPIDHRLHGRSSWLAVARGEHAKTEERGLA